MTLLVHITDEKNAASIQRSGIRPSKLTNVVYFMPVVHSHFVSHQWVRELRRSGAKTLVGVYFRLPSNEPVWAAKYSERHRRETLGSAIARLNSLTDPLGFELFIERKILPSELHAIRHLPQVLGWRYHPHAHGKEPCPCPACLTRGAIKSKSIRQRDPTRVKPPTLEETLNALKGLPTGHDPTTHFWALRTKRRVLNPSFLEPYMGVADAAVLTELALTLPYLRDPLSMQMLQRLGASDHADVREAAAEGMLCIKSGRRPSRR